MPDRSIPALGLGALLTALLLAACGSSSGKTATVSTASAKGGTATTKAQFVSQAQEICRALDTQEASLKTRQESLKKLPTAQAESVFVELARTVVRDSKAAEAKLRALPEPAADEAAIGKLLTSLEAEIGDTTTLADAAAKEEANLGEAASESLHKQITTNRQLSAEYGMTLCTSGE